MDIDSDPASDMTQVKVVFTTTEEDIQLPESKRLLIVPADIRRYGLSRILNSESMLDTAPAIPFDFLVDGAFLRSTLADYLRDSGLSSETTVTLQYVRSLIPPVFEASFQHDDWVSAVDVSPDAAAAAASAASILSASYDGLLRLWNASGEVVATSADAAHGGHTAAIKAARFVTPTQIVSAGIDRTVRVWKPSASDSALLQPTLELHGHKAAVEAIAVDGAARRVLTASADGCVGVWTTSKTAAPAVAEPDIVPLDETTTKRRKVATSTITQRGPLGLVRAHKAPATAVVFDPRDRTVAYAASLDHTLSTLDLTTGQVVGAVATSHPLLALCALGRADSGGSGTAPLLAAGNAARNIVLVDPRAAVATTAVLTLRGHVNKVAALAPSPDHSHSLVSASHDGTCRLWDLRSSARHADEAVPVAEAVYVIDRQGREGKRRPLAGEGTKVFDVVWDATLGIVSGGEDKRVQINRSRGVMAAS